MLCKALRQAARGATRPHLAGKFKGRGLHFRICPSEQQRRPAELWNIKDRPMPISVII